MISSAITQLIKLLRFSKASIFRGLVMSDLRRFLSRTRGIPGIFLSLLLMSCVDNGEIGNYRYRSDMHTQPSFKRHEDPRAPVPGTVPVGGLELPIRDSVQAASLRNPVFPTQANRDSSRFLYETYCSPCHGMGAKGDGLVAAKFQVPPDLTAPKYRRVPDGYLYFVIRHGRLIMPPYYEGVKSRERWMIVNYLRELQK